jgi:16S rRNA (cytosine1407-C5)-methyltransferase
MIEDLPQLPSLFLERLQRIVPPDTYDSCVTSFAIRRPTAFRVNTLKVDRDGIRTELETQGFKLATVDWLPDAFLVEADQRRALTETSAFHEGRIYVQNLSSMVAPMVLNPQPGEQVLDLAAAPGGKCLQMAAMMNDLGRIVAVDAVKKRFFRLRANVGRSGTSIVDTYLMDGRRSGRRWPGTFDAALLDAPCSSEGRFSQLAPRSWQYWSLRKVRESARKQVGLLKAALDSLKPGGSLLYCTCAFSPEENEAVVDTQLARYNYELTIVPVVLPVCNTQVGIARWEDREFHPDLSRCVRILPTGAMEGFFLCKLRKGEPKRGRDRRL